MHTFRVDEYIESRPTGRHWDVSAIDIFEAVDLAWYMQYTVRGPRGDLIPKAIVSDENRENTTAVCSSIESNGKDHRSWAIP